MPFSTLVKSAGASSVGLASPESSAFILDSDPQATAEDRIHAVAERVHLETFSNINELVVDEEIEVNQSPNNLRLIDKAENEAFTAISKSTHNPALFMAHVNGAEYVPKMVFADMALALATYKQIGGSAVALDHDKLSRKLGELVMSDKLGVNSGFSAWSNANNQGDVQKFSGKILAKLDALGGEGKPDLFKAIFDEKVWPEIVNCIKNTHGELKPDNWNRVKAAKGTISTAAAEAASRMLKAIPTGGTSAGNLHGRMDEVRVAHHWIELMRSAEANAEDPAPVADGTPKENSPLQRSSSSPLPEFSNIPLRKYSDETVPVLPANFPLQPINIKIVNTNNNGKDDSSPATPQPTPLESPYKLIVNDNPSVNTRPVVGGMSGTSERGDQTGATQNGTSLIGVQTSGVGQRAGSQTVQLMMTSVGTQYDAESNLPGGISTGLRNRGPQPKLPGNLLSDLNGLVKDPHRNTVAAVMGYQELRRLARVQEELNVSRQGNRPNDDSQVDARPVVGVMSGTSETGDQTGPVQSNTSGIGDQTGESVQGTDSHAGSSQSVGISTGLMRNRGTQPKQPADLPSDLNGLVKDPYRNTVATVMGLQELLRLARAQTELNGSRQGNRVKNDSQVGAHPVVGGMSGTSETDDQTGVVQSNTSGIGDQTDASMQSADSHAGSSQSVGFSTGLIRNGGTQAKLPADLLSDLNAMVKDPHRNTVAAVMGFQELRRLAQAQTKLNDSRQSNRANGGSQVGARPVVVGVSGTSPAGALTNAMQTNTSGIGTRTSASVQVTDSNDGQRIASLGSQYATGSHPSLDTSTSLMRKKITPPGSLQAQVHALLTAQHRNTEATVMAQQQARRIAQAQTKLNDSRKRDLGLELNRWTETWKKLEEDQIAATAVLKAQMQFMSSATSSTNTDASQLASPTGSAISTGTQSAPIEAFSTYQNPPRVSLATGPKILAGPGFSKVENGIQVPFVPPRPPHYGLVPTLKVSSDALSLNTTYPKTRIVNPANQANEGEQIRTA
ncbi:hypothetical protein [Glaciimonas immobilis]|uniref:Uncharacterized protein n=1 Tax=Glaciimonas immobilis TaxID=728004 RepID=A0A840RMD6_9BURK|nr:hypothetical protein [Glaciimonas immobilis]KAF3999343.1 hypothetical protein HAV38_05275 [Glaciimonas immobilis]MBB5198825.1 hypothetical protein [Glaciimonas immobilis]